MKRKKIVSRGASVLLAALIFATLCMPALAANADEKTITLVGTSDIHGCFMPWDYASDAESTSGSLAQIATAIKEIQAENPNTIVLDIGDTIQGNSAELFQDMEAHPVPTVFNALGYRYWTLGNHEFDYGMEKLDKIVGQFEGKTLAGNVYTKDGKPYYDATDVVELDGVKLGVVGMTTPMVQEFKEDTDIFKNHDLKDPVPETKAAIKALTSEKVDAIVGIMHMGVENENERPNTGVRDIANACPELDVIFAGHMHTLVEGENINGVLIAEPNRYATHISRVDLTFAKEGDGWELKDKKATVISMADYEADPKVEALLEPYHSLAREDANEVIGQLTGGSWVPEKANKEIPVTQVQQTPLADFFAAVMFEYSDGADVVAFQIDSDNAGLEAGPIKKKDIAYNYQYATGEVTNYKITGKDLKAYMEWSADYFNQAQPGDVTISFNPERRNSKYVTFDYFYGVSYEIDLTKPSGSRVVNVKWPDGKALKDTDSLVLGMNAYRMKQLMAEGAPLEGLNPEQLRSTIDETAYGEVEGTIRRLSIRYIKEKMKGVVKATVGDTWRIVGVEETPDYVLSLINDDIIAVPAAENGRSNVAAVNLQKTATDEDIQAIAEKIGVKTDAFQVVKTLGDLYQQAEALRSEGEVLPGDTVQEDVREVSVYD